MVSGDRRLALRVLTLNLWAMGGSWTDRRQVIAEGIQTLDPDLMACQEAVKDADPTLPIMIAGSLSISPSTVSGPAITSVSSLILNERDWNNARRIGS